MQTAQILTGADHDPSNGNRFSVRQAITTRCVRERVQGVNTLDFCVEARCDAKCISVVWDDALGIAENHAAAALQLMSQLGWSERNDLVMGSAHRDYVFVQVPKFTR